MANYDMTSSSTISVGADSIAAKRSMNQSMVPTRMEAILDIGALTEAGYTCANGDIFQLLEIPAGSFVLFGGAEVHTVFDGTTPTVDIDFGEGDDIVDGGDVTALGFLAKGAGGQANEVTTGAASTFTQFVSTTDTIDVKLIAASADVTAGVLRVYAWVYDCNEYGNTIATEVDRDQLA